MILFGCDTRLLGTSTSDAGDAAPVLTACVILISKAIFTADMRKLSTRFSARRFVLLAIVAQHLSYK